MLNQFRTLPQLLDFFKDEQTCKDYLAKHRWNDKVTCPFCDHDHIYITNRGYKCANKKCHKKFSVTVGTIFENSKLPLRTWYAAIYLVSSHKKGISSLQLGRDLGIDKKNAWFVLHRIREAFFPNMPLLEDVVSVDETFIGGKNKNRHADKKYDGGQGGQSEDKTIVMGAMQIGGIVVTKIVPDRSAETLIPALDKIVKKGAILVTDDHRAYYKVKKDYFHIVVNHSEGQYVNGAFTTNNIEGFWSLFKRGYIGIYHYMSPTHLDRYCNEFAYRYNSRKTPDMDRFSDAIIRTHGKRLTWNQLTGKNPTKVA